MPFSLLGPYDTLFHMSPELIGIIGLGVTTLGVGIALAGLILPGQHKMRRDIVDLRERMARLEGLIEGLFRRRDEAV